MSLLLLIYCATARYAIAFIGAGDDIKTIQYNLGHATAAFTLDKYAHYTGDMRRDSAARMGCVHVLHRETIEALFKSVKGKLKGKTLFSDTKKALKR